MKIHKFLQSHVTHYNTISHGVHPPPSADHEGLRRGRSVERSALRFLLKISKYF